MEEYVIIKTFSGEKKISKRKMELYEYYDGDIPELDDTNLIVENKITKLEIINSYDKTVGYNYYNDKGFPVKFITNSDGKLTEVSFCRSDEGIFSWLEIKYTVESDVVNVGIEYSLKESEYLSQNIVIKGAAKESDTCINELFSVKIKKLSGERSVKNIRVQDIDNVRFSVEVYSGNEMILQLD